MDAKLDAINHILSAIGESPVNSIEDPTNVDVIGALDALERANRSFQRRGWFFNTVAEYKLNPDFYTKKISWNPTILRFINTNGTIYNKRGDYLYNFTDQTELFTGPVVISAVLLQDFEDLPEAAQSYITAKTALDFQVNYQGDELNIQRLQQKEAEAWQDFKEFLLEAEGNSNMFDNEETYSILGGRS